MSDMEEAEVYLQAKKEAESAKMDNVDLSTLVESSPPNSRSRRKSRKRPRM